MAAAEALILHDSVAAARGEKISGREDRNVAVPKLERGVLERRRRRDAGVGDDDVQAAVGDDRLAERGVDRRLVRHVDVDSGHRVLAESLAEVGNRRIQALGVDVGEHDASALAHKPSCDRLSDSARAAGHQRDAPGERFRLRQALKLGLFEQPIFDIEGFLLLKSDIAADAGCATHHVDRVDVEFRAGAGGRLILGEGQHADARNEIDDGVGIAHRRRVRPFTALIISRVVGAIIGKILVERRNDRIEIARRRIEWQHERADLGAQEVIRAGCPERRQGP